jgi:hypothetical protein
VGTWSGSDAFYVKSPDTSAVLIRLSDIQTIRAASGGELLDVPDRHSSSRLVIVVAAVAAGLVILAAIGHGLAKS